MKRDGILKKNRAVCLTLVIIIVLTITVCMQVSGKYEFTGITSEVALSMFRNTTIKIHSLNVGENVDISGKISTSDGDVKFHFTGNVYVSEKQKQGIEAYVAQVVDCENNFVVNYFEIKNDTSKDLFKYSEENLSKRIISFDLERNGVQYYFELDMDALGISFNAEHITEAAPEEIDFYGNYVNEEKSIAPCIIYSDLEEYQMVRLGDVHSYTAIGDYWYHKLVVDSWFGNETIYEYYAEPRIEGEISNVGTASSCMWTSKLIFEGYVEKNGARIDSLDNVFSIDEIKFQIDLGENTICTSGEFNGICHINGLESSYSNMFVSGPKENSVYHPFDDVVLLDKENCYLMFSGVVSSINSNSVSNQETNCIVRWSYHMCYDNKILPGGSVTVEKMIAYIVNMK